MKRQRLVSQGSLSRTFEAVAAAWKRQEYQEAIDLLERARKLDPANPGILLDLGRAYGMRYDYPAAERCFEAAIRVAPRKTDAIIAAGRRCQEFGKYGMARRYFEQASQRPDATAEVFVTLAELYERHHQLDDATQLTDRALELDAGRPLARLVRARLDRLAGRWIEAEERVRALLDTNEGDPWLRARAWYELAGILDRQARHDDAMQALLEAKGLLRPAAGHHAAILRGIQERVLEMETSISTGVLERWAEAAASLEPCRRLSVLCGHPRSGTTLLEQILDGHPDIVTAEETHILHDEAYLPLSRGFAPDASLLSVLESAPLSRLRQSREDYSRFTGLFIGDPISGRLLVDKNPALNVLIPAVARIFPEASFLIALRDPRDVCLSCFMQPLALNPVSSAYLDLENTVTQYLSVMNFWRTLLPRLRSAHIEVRYEKLVGDLEGVSRRVLGALGVVWDDRVLKFYEHARTKPVRSPSYAEVVKPVSRSAVGRWEHYRKHLEPSLHRLGPILKELGYE